MLIHFASFKSRVLKQKQDTLHAEICKAETPYCEANRPCGSDWLRPADLLFSSFHKLVSLPEARISRASVGM